jgi:hypothetical protein
MTQSLWTLEDLAATPDDIDSYAREELLEPHEDIWPAPGTFEKVCEELLGWMPSRHLRTFLSFCLASYLLNPKKAPKGFVDWFGRNSSAQEIFGLDHTVKLEVLGGYRWGRVAIALGDPHGENRGHIIYALAAAGCAELPLIPPQSEPCLDSSARRAVALAASLAKGKSDVNCFFWPLLPLSEERPQIIGGSLGLPVYLALDALTHGGQVPRGAIATGGLNELGELTQVRFLEQKIACAGDLGFHTFIYPRRNAALHDSRVEALPAADRSHALDLWRRLAPGATQNDLSQRLPRLSFTYEMDRLTTLFLGRGWLFSQIDAWAADPDGKRVFWISGGPGTGKSAISAKLCRERDYVAGHHFCDTTPGMADAAPLLRSLAYQLAGCLDGYREYLHRLDPQLLHEDRDRVLFRTLFMTPFADGFIPPLKALVLLVDGLDEASRSKWNDIAELISQEAERLPPWLRFLVTFRNEPRQVSQFVGYPGTKLEQECRFQEEDRHSISVHLAGHFPEATPEQRADLIERSEGVFLYLHCVCREISEGGLSFNTPEKFPLGLTGVYRRFFDRIPFDEVEPLLQLLVAAKEPPPTTLLQRVQGMKSMGELKKQLKTVGSLLLHETHESVDGNVVVVRPFHKSLVDWLTDERSSGEYHVIPADGDSLFAEAASGVPLRELPGYLLAWLPTHLSRCGRRSAASDFLKDFGVMMIRARHGLVERMLADYREANDPALGEEAAFFRVNAHLLRRGHKGWPPFKILLQLASEYADSATITVAADRWLEEKNCDWLWLRRKGRPAIPPASLCMETFPIMPGEIGGVREMHPGEVLAWSKNGTFRIFDAEGPSSCEFDLLSLLARTDVVMEWWRSSRRGAVLVNSQGALSPHARGETNFIRTVSVVDDLIIIVFDTEATGHRDLRMESDTVEIKVRYAHGTLHLEAYDTVDLRPENPFNRGVTWARQREFMADCLLITKMSGAAGKILGYVRLDDGTYLTYSDSRAIQRWPANLLDTARRTLVPALEACDFAVDSNTLVRISAPFPQPTSFRFSNLMEDIDDIPC